MNRKMRTTGRQFHVGPDSEFFREVAGFVARTAAVVVYGDPLFDKPSEAAPPARNR